MTKSLKRDKYIQLICPKCNNTRKIKYRSFWSNPTTTKTVCLKCANQKVTSTSFKKGQTPWNKGKGTLTISQRLKADKRWKEWREKIFKRDKYRCVHCGKGGQLEPDHIYPASLFPDLAYQLWNGRTLCKSCHKNTETYGFKIKGYLTKLINREIKRALEAEKYN